VTLNAGRSWSPFGEAGLNFYNVILHEVGHSLGLDHPDDPAQVMYEFYLSDATLRLAPGDMAGIDFIYGGGDGRVPLLGTFAGDTITRSGTAGEILFGLAGDDTITGGQGDDRISGGSGRDTISGGGGNDDIADLSGGATISGGSGNDRIFGGLGPITADGETGDDLIVGGSGSDTLSGGSGRDVILGEAPGVPFFGNDRIDGGPGDDLLAGGGGADVFVFRAGGGNDLVAAFDMDWATPLASRAVGRDFVPGIDRIAFDAGTFATADEVLAATTDTGAGAVIRLDGATSLTLAGVTAAELSADSFLFGMIA
jgi:Ca2+-binding RTX toxin-like protein